MLILGFIAILTFEKRYFLRMIETIYLIKKRLYSWYLKQATYILILPNAKNDESIESGDERKLKSDKF